MIGELLGDRDLHITLGDGLPVAIRHSVPEQLMDPPGELWAVAGAVRRRVRRLSVR